MLRSEQRLHRPSNTRVHLWVGSCGLAALLRNAVAVLANVRLPTVRLLRLLPVPPPVETRTERVQAGAELHTTILYRIVRSPLFRRSSAG